MPLITASEVTIEGTNGRIVWQIQHATDRSGPAALASLVYGEVPNGWVEVMKALKLRPCVYYSINEEYYFIRDDNYCYSVLPREEYFGRRRAAREIRP